MVNSLCSSIINYEAVHKPNSIGSYVESKNDLDDEMFFTDRQYRQDRPMRGRLRGDFSSSRPLYWPGIFQRTKKCFVCGKVGCWSSNHTRQERDDSKKKFGDRYPKYKTQSTYERNFKRWITEYKGIDDNKDIAHYFDNLSIDADHDYTPGSGSFHTESEQFHTSIGQLDSAESKTVINTRADNAFKHQITLSDKIVSPTTLSLYVFNSSTDF